MSANDENPQSVQSEYTPVSPPNPFTFNTEANEPDASYLREKLASAFLILYIMVGFFFAVLAIIALATIIAASNYLNRGWSKNIATLLLVTVGLVCVLISAVFTILICSSPAYNYSEKAQKSTRILLIASSVLIGASVGLFCSGAFSKTTAEFQGAFMGLVYGLVGFQIARECAAEKETKQSSLLVPFKIA